MKKRGNNVSRDNKEFIANNVWMLINEPKLLKAWRKEAHEHIKDGVYQPDYPEHTIGAVKWWILRLGGYI